ncbi:MAG: maltose alpha-D-glucosyltransferase [Acidobacteria bacterium]|nr:maltose alpha-D-glucosyltransferase [Acidobacteriota bacterium]
MPRPGSASDPLWYKDAIIYEIPVKSFFDANHDGIGDFPGLIEKLDYVQELGVTCLWILPFYPSPLRDDGYDIAQYEGIHPSYGTLRDFKAFLRAAHDRNLQVITELVINHTSDQHPWFQAARRARAGSSKRSYYVWSDTDQVYQDARIIFTDTERSNWTWDAEAKAFYWHRFFHHQPDLNFDNPRVLRAVNKVMQFWLDMGVDGMRLDAIPYLIEREGTSCENLPETHVILQEIRRTLDAHYDNRMLLAEANQWPADVRPYFGEGDECHMAFHFPVMPRIFMALRQEDRHPITEILRQTPDIPDTCQWALFLRNHDELTLEMVTDEERDYMYQAYAADPQMRLNLGIRRRLAPLVENSRPRIELLTSLLCSLPGTPVLYYGDEIGMGDNVFLGDRNGVRTPMQWTADRNAGFSRADPARLYSPPIMDPVYGYGAINVEAQERSPFSLLNWTKRLLTLRRQHKTFGRGTLEILYPQNRKVLAYVRRYGDDVILVVANLSRSIQPVELSLAAFHGLTPVEIIGRIELPRIGDSPYFLTLGPYSIYWFQLVKETTPVAIRTTAVPAESAELPALFAGTAWDTLLDGHVRTLIERECLPPFLERQRWFGGKARRLRSTRIADWTPLRKGPAPAFLAFVHAEYADGGHESYFMPLVLLAGTDGEERLKEAPEAAIARVTGARKGVLMGVFGGAESIGEVVLEAIEASRQIPTRRGGGVRAFSTPRYPETRGPSTPRPITRGRSDASNTSLIFSDRLVLKLFRRMQVGPNPDLEIGHYLTDRAQFPRVPPVVGGLTYSQPGGGDVTLAMLQGFITSQANGWDHALYEAGRYFERVQTTPDFSAIAGEAIVKAPDDRPDEFKAVIGGYTESVALLGRRTAELHLALAADSSDIAFAPEPLTPDDLKGFGADARQLAKTVWHALDDTLARTDGPSPEVRQVLALGDRIMERLRGLESLDLAVSKIRVHGDYHLGQVLWVEGDFIIIDFEGEPTRPIDVRRRKQLALKDVAGMLRSYNYAAYAEMFAEAGADAEALKRLEPWADLWARVMVDSFLRSYRATAGAAPFLPEPTQFQEVLDFFMLEKALYELGYELNNRPDWIRIPIRGILELTPST